VGDPDERFLMEAPIVSLAAARGPLIGAGVFDAVLAGADGRRAAVMTVALESAPVAFKRPLAVHRLARALGLHVVPVAVVRAVAAGELAALLDGSPASAVLKQARVQNDGTVDVLLAACAPAAAGSPWEPLRAAPIDPRNGREVTAWERWAQSPAPAPGEDPELIRDHVEMLALDYLSAHAARRSARLAGHALILDDNAGAFPPNPDAPSIDSILRRLRAFQRFPRGLRDALARFDRARAAATFARGRFETWLLSPRALVELEERRAGLLSLLEARIQERGAEAVLSL
jgi:hypothetical protein